MPRYEYKVVPAPKRAPKVRGLKGTEARFAHALAEIMNDLGADGWEYQRTDSLPCEERTGLISGKTVAPQNMLVFRRSLPDAGAPSVEAIASIHMSDTPAEPRPEPVRVPDVAARPRPVPAPEPVAEPEPVPALEPVAAAEPVIPPQPVPAPAPEAPPLSAPRFAAPRRPEPARHDLADAEPAERERPSRVTALREADEGEPAMAMPSFRSTKAGPALASHGPEGRSPRLGSVSRT